MSTPALPQEGWWTADEWARALDESTETFRRKVARFRIPHRLWGNLMFVNAADFYAHVPGESYVEAEGER